MSAPTQFTYDVFVSYSHADEQWVRDELWPKLEGAGLKISDYLEFELGVPKIVNIERAIEASRKVLLVLTPDWIASEWANFELLVIQTDDPSSRMRRTLPLLLKPCDMPKRLSILTHADFTQPSTRAADIIRLIRQIQTHVADTGQSGDTPEQPTIPPTLYINTDFINSLREPSGVVEPRSDFYVEREGDRLLRRELSKSYGTTTTILAPWQTGKSSLLQKAGMQARERGSKFVIVNLQLVDDSTLQSLDTFLRSFALTIIIKLHLEVVEVERIWQSSMGALDKITYLLEDYVLPSTETKITLAIDEADRLVNTSFQDSFFGLLRSWHNYRPTNSIWDKLDIVMTMSNEPYLLIQNIHQSPFNVGLVIRLDDFKVNQVDVLNNTYQSPLKQNDVIDLMTILNGHPYLTHKAMYTMVTENMTWSELKRISTSNLSPFDNHLRHYLYILRNQPRLGDAIKQIIARGKCSDESSYHRLLQAGLVKGSDSQIVTCRCKLYEEYLKDKL
jgi:hypothetical protein